MPDYRKDLNLDSDLPLTLQIIKEAHRKIIKANGAGLAGLGTETESADLLAERIKAANIARDALLASFKQAGGSTTEERSRGSDDRDATQAENEGFRESCWTRGESMEARHQRYYREALRAFEANPELAEELLASMSAYELLFPSKHLGRIFAERFPDAYREKVFPYFLEIRAERGATWYDEELIEFIRQDPALAPIVASALRDDYMATEFFEVLQKTMCPEYEVYEQNSDVDMTPPCDDSLVSEGVHSLQESSSTRILRQLASYFSFYSPGETFVPRALLDRQPHAVRRTACRFGANRL